MPEKEINSIADAINVIDDVITREIEWADGPTDDIQKAWNIIRNRL